MEDADLRVRPLTDGDALLLLHWLSDPRVARWWGGPHDEARVRRDFYGRLGPGERHCVVELAGRPVGFVQFYPSYAPFWQRVHGYGGDERLWGMDQFIGDPALWNRGLGTRLVTLVSRYLIAEHDATRVLVDPVTHNARAIRCYEKAGFTKVRLLPSHEDDGSDCWLMELRSCD